MKEEDKLMNAANYHYLNVTRKGKFQSDLNYIDTLELMQGYADQQSAELKQNIDILNDRIKFLSENIQDLLNNK